ncbi:MAG: hypothetical protein KGZ38_01340 [Erysipelothrix sp.]|nr:hypothetical protein [Erysipelothrix sp.]
MFKKLMSFLFEEVDVVEEEIEPSYDPSLSQEVKHTTMMPSIEVSEEQYVEKDIPLVSQKSFNLQMDQEVKVPEVKVPLRKEKSVDQPYQMNGIISPIFGKKEQASTSQKVSQTPLPLPQENTSVLGTVFSPIYGVVRGKPVMKQATVPVKKNVSMDELFSDEDIAQPIIHQPVLETLFEEPISKPSNRHFIEEDHENEEESVQTMFRSLFDEQE